VLTLISCRISALDSWTPKKAFRLNPILDWEVSNCNGESRSPQDGGFVVGGGRVVGIILNSGGIPAPDTKLLFSVNLFAYETSFNENRLIPPVKLETIGYDKFYS
jgi:hypothetical protein